MVQEHTKKSRDRESPGYGAGIAALSRSLHFAFIILSALIIGIIAWYISFGGYFTVPPQETVLVLRFGKIVDTYKEGWHWVFPYPVHQIIRIPTDQRNIQTDHFWHAANIDILRDPEEQLQGGPLKPGVDGYLLTGDANIIHTKWSMTYEISNPEEYYNNFLCPPDPRARDHQLTDEETGQKIGSRGPESFLRCLLESVILKTAAGLNVDTALYKDSSEFNNDVQSKMQKILLDQKLGIKINVYLTDKMPPIDTLQAFQSVIAAEQDAHNEKLQAQRYATQTAGKARSDAARILAEAETYRKNIVADIDADNTYFQQILTEFRANPETVLVALYSDALGEVLTRTDDTFIIRDNPENGRQQVRILLNKEPEYSRNKDEE